jgi:hypothetical protein
MPGVGYLGTRTDGGQLRGGAPRVVWQTLDTDPRLVSAKSAAQHLNQTGRPAHVVWNPLTGEIVQLISVLRAGCRLGGPAQAASAGPVSTSDGRSSACSTVGSEGRVCVQIAVVAFAWEPFTDGPLSGVEPIVGWLDSWHVPRQWPAGRPSPFAQAHGEPRSRRHWARGGHFGASQVPACGAAGPGAIDIERLTGPSSPAAIGVPAPRADSRPGWAAARPVAPVRLAAARASAPGSPAASGMR